MNKKVRRAGPVVVSCLSCGWSATGSTWRPTRRQLAAHVAKQHPGLVGA